MTDLPLSATQEGLWTLQRAAPASSSYNTCAAARLFGPVDLEALARAVAALGERHQALRSVFSTSGGKPAQRFDAPAARLRSIETGDAASADRRLLAECSRPFDLEGGPLFRAALIRGGDRRALALVSHHAVLDRPSWQVLLEELSALYALAEQGRAPELAEPADEYARFVAWEADMLSSERGAAAGRFWLDELRGAPALELPLDDPRGEPAGGDSARLALGPSATAALRRYAARDGKTVYSVLAAAYAAVLGRYTGQEELLIGCPTLGARLPGFERLVGNLVNPVALRLSLAGEPSGRELVARVQAKVRAALARKEYPFARVVKDLNPPRAAGQAPVFQTALNLVKPLSAVRLGRGRLVPLELPTQEGQFDLDAVVLDEGARLSIRFKHRPSRLFGETARRLARHFERQLAAIVERPAEPALRAPILSPEERRACVVSGPARRLSGRCLHELIAARARRTPDALAVRDEDGATLTYRQLEEAAGRTAARLRALGARRDEPVGLCVGRGIGMVSAMLGILKSGAAYLPLDPAYPAQRLAFMLQDSGARLVLSERALAGAVPPGRARVELLDGPAGRGRPGRTARGSERLAYILYTSGSTGAPKGVAVQHGSVVNVLVDLGRELQVTEQDAVLAVTTLSFDIAALELLMPLLHGARVELVSRATALDGRALAARLVASAATILQATPATWRLLLESGWSGAPGLKALCGGEAWTEELAARLLDKGLSLWNVYGPTETTIWSTVGRVRRGRPVPLGRPVANTRLRVLDARGEPAPPGARGELCIAGAGVARGYLGRKELTASRFLPEPGRRGGRLYRTGDRARLRAEGTIELLGRLDHQVKIRGFRVELAEVEAALRGCPGVRAAAATAVPGADGESRLAGYVALEPGQPLSPAALRERLRGTLPDYMLPSVFVALEELPLTPNGKVDRAALPPPSARPACGGEPAREPRDAAEGALLAAFRQVLGRPALGVDDDFFDAGGDSLLAVEAAAAAGEAGVPVSPAEVLDRRTVAALAELARSRRACASDEK